MSTTFSAPFPKIKVTTVLPDAEFLDTRTPESEIQQKRSMLGRVITYVKSSTRRTLRLQFLLSRMKDLELDQFIQAYHTAKWKLTLHDGTIWSAQLVGDPIRRVAITRRAENDSRTGDELMRVELEFSAEKLN